MKMFAVISILAFLAGAPLFSEGQAEEKPDDSMGGSMMMSADSMEPGHSSGFPEFKSIDEAKMLAGIKPTVLFFYADWCPTCRAAVSEMKAEADSLRDINLLIVDYDNSDELKMKYGVSYQHTFVQIDQQGMAVSTWNGGDSEKILEMVSMKEM